MTKKHGAKQTFFYDSSCGTRVKRDGSFIIILVKINCFLPNFLICDEPIYSWKAAAAHVRFSMILFMML